MEYQTVELIAKIFRKVVVSDDELTNLLKSISSLMNAVRVMRYPANHILCHEGKVEDVFYILAEGKAEISRKLGVDDTKSVVAVKEAGDFFGEMALVLDKPRSADVITVTECVVLEMDRKLFLDLTKRTPYLARELARITIEHLEDNIKREELERGNTHPRQFKIFTSYSHEDEAFVKPMAERLQNDLRNTHIQLWIDSLNIAPGEEWDIAIDEALDKCHAMMLVLSPKSLKSKHVRDEWSYYLDEVKPIIPLLIQPVEKLPSRLRRLQYIDFTKLEYTTALARIDAALIEIAEAKAKI